MKQGRKAEHDSLAQFLQREAAGLPALLPASGSCSSRLCVLLFLHEHLPVSLRSVTFQHVGNPAHLLVSGCF